MNAILRSYWKCLPQLVLGISYDGANAIYYYLPLLRRDADNRLAHRRTDFSRGEKQAAGFIRRDGKGLGQTETGARINFRAGVEFDEGPRPNSRRKIPGSKEASGKGQRQTLPE